MWGCCASPRRALLVLLLLPLLALLPAAAASPDNADRAEPVYAAFLSGGIGWPPPGGLQLLSTRTCSLGGFMAVYGYDATPLLVVVYAPANATAPTLHSIVGECLRTVSECYPRTSIVGGVWLHEARVEVQASVLPARKPPRTTITTTTTTAAASKAVVREESVMTQATTLTVTTMRAVSRAEAPPPATPTTARVEAYTPATTTTGPPGAAGGAPTAERLVLVFAPAASAALLVYLAWRTRS